MPKELEVIREPPRLPLPPESRQPLPPGQQLLHRSLLDGPLLGDERFQRSDQLVHVGQHGGDGALFGKGREGELCARDVSAVGCIDLSACRESAQVTKKSRVKLQVGLEAIGEH